MVQKKQPFVKCGKRLESEQVLVLKIIDGLDRYYKSLFWVAFSICFKISSLHNLHDSTNAKTLISIRKVVHQDLFWNRHKSNLWPIYLPFIKLLKLKHQYKLYTMFSCKFIDLMRGRHCFLILIVASVTDIILIKTKRENLMVYFRNSHSAI